MNRFAWQLSFTLMMATIFFVTGNNIFLGNYIHAEPQSQTISNVCNGDNYPCYTTFCSGDLPCQTFSCYQPSVMQPVDETSVMQPVDETSVMQPVDETSVMQPVDEEQVDRDQNDAFRVDDQVNFLDLDPQEVVSTEDAQEVKEQHSDDKDEEEKYSGDEHEKFERVLYGTPEGVEVETETRGIEIFVDYVEFFDDQQNLVTENPERHYNGGPLELRRGGTLTLNFADCHTECNQPDAIRSVYLVDGNVDDNDILNDKVNDDQKATFEQIDSSSFQFRVPDGVTGSNTFNKLVIETDQTDEIDAFYIAEGVQIS
jgi:hypothetical protein